MINHVVSLIGPTAVGKTSFATWFIDRNPLYTHIDIARLRIKYGVLDLSRSTHDRLASEEQVWKYIQFLVHQSQLVILESTGLSSRLQHVYDLAGSTCVVKLIDQHEELVTRILKRNNPNADLELVCLDQDIHDISNLFSDLVCINLTEPFYPKLEEQIFLSLVEKYKFPEE